MLYIKNSTRSISTLVAMEIVNTVMGNTKEEKHDFITVRNS